MRDALTKPRAYLLAVMMTLVAIGARGSIHPWLSAHLALVTLFPAVAAASWYGGAGPAATAAILGYLACNYLFMDPPGHFGITTAPDWVGLTAFAVSCAIIIACSAARQRARQQADDGRTLLNVTLASIGEAVITTDRGGQVTYMNPAAEAMTGRRLAQASGKPLGEVFAIRDEDTGQPLEVPSLSRVLEARRRDPARRTVLLRPDGTALPIDDGAAAIRAADDRIVGCVVVFRDVSERRQARRALERSERELADFFENASIALQCIGRDGTILRANQAALDLLGHDREDYIGAPIARFHVDAERIADLLQRVSAGERLPVTSAQLRHRDGTIRDVLISSSGYFEDGRFVHSRCSTIDVTERRRAEAARDLLASVVTASDDAIISQTLDGAILSWNGGAERIFGFSATEMIGQSIERITPPDLRAEQRTILARLQRGERIDHFATTRAARDGRRIDVSITVSPVLDDAGRVVGASKVARDITGQRLAQEALRDSEQRLRFAQRAGRAGVFEWYIPEDRIWWSPELEALYGVPEGSFGGSIDHWRRLVVDADARRVLDDITVCMEQRRAEIAYEFRIVWPDGSRRWLAGQARFLYDAHGNALRMVGVNVDIDDHKRTEQALRKAEEDFRTLADHISQFCWMADEHGWIFWYNRRWYEYTGTTLEQMQGWGWRAVHHPDHVERVIERLQRSWDTGEPWEDSFPLRGKDGRFRWFLSRALPIRNAEGEVVRWFGTNTDITEHRHMEEALREANRRKDEFIATLAHELRNPLAPLRHMLEILKHHGDDRPLQQQALATMERQTRHLARLVDDLLDMSRINSNKLELRREPLDLLFVLNQAIEVCRPQLDRYGHQISITLPATPIALNGDAMRLAQVFGNLLNNACKYTRAGGRIAVTATREDSQVAIAVKDDGIGIPPAMLPQVFDMFTQVDRSLEASDGGLGIGLTLVRQLVHLHDGSVTAASEGQGKGSEFVVRLPIAATSAGVADTATDCPPTPPATPPPAAPTPSRRVLVVDDNKDSALSLALLLKLGGHDTRVAHDGLAALAEAELFRPEVILLDIGLPRLNGLDTCRRLRQQPWGATALVIALTGWGQDEDRRRSTDAGFDHHLVKPIDPDTLRALLEIAAEQ